MSKYNAAEVAYNARIERKDTDDVDAPVTTQEFKTAWEKFHRLFNEFKTENDGRLQEVEKKGVSDTIVNEHVEKLNSAITEQQTVLDKFIAEQKRVPIGDDKDKKLTEVELEHKKLFDKYVRKGQHSTEDALTDVELKMLEEKALSVGDATMGGFITPIEQSFEMDRLVTEISPIRQIAQVQQISTGKLTKPFNLTGTASGWVGETEARPQTDNAQLDQLTFVAHELYAMPIATQTLLDDAAIDMESWINKEVSIEFARQEGAAFVNGNGVNKPRGFLAYPTIDEEASDWAWGSIGYFPTGTATGLGSSDDLIDLVYLLKSDFRSNAKWTMNRKTQASVRKLKDMDDQYLWQPGLQMGQPAMLLGYPITEAEDMPDITVDDSYPMAFGDFRSGYLIVDRIGVRILRDPFTSKPYVLFYTTKRVGGGVQNFEAIKLLKIEDA